MLRGESGTTAAASVLFWGMGEDPAIVLGAFACGRGSFSDQGAAVHNSPLAARHRPKVPALARPANPAPSRRA